MKNPATLSEGPDESDWSGRRRRVRGAPRDLDLYVVNLAAVGDWAARSTVWLADDELARSNGLRDDTQRREFLLSRMVLRRFLALRLGCSPDVVELPRNCATGAPGPASVRTGVRTDSAALVHYSLARTPGYVAIVIGNRPVGVDLERRQSRAQTELLLGVLHSADQARLLRAPRRRRARLVTDAWVRLEALVKARGTGLSTDPSSLRVGPSRRVRYFDGVVVTGVRLRRSSRVHAAVAWLQGPQLTPDRRP